MWMSSSCSRIHGLYTCLDMWHRTWNPQNFLLWHLRGLPLMWHSSNWTRGVDLVVIMALMWLLSWC